MASNFATAIEQRNKNKIKSELTFIGIKESKVEKYEKIKNNLFATVKIVCEIISVKKNQENKIIEGNPDKIKTVTDYWKFSKNSLTQSPNWYLAEIISKVKKKFTLPISDLKDWQEYTHNPKDIYDKDQDNQSRKKIY